MERLGLKNRKLICSYVDITEDASADSDFFFVTDSENTVADVYEDVIKDYKMLLAGDGFRVTDHGAYTRSDGNIAYITWEEHEDYDDSIVVEHEELLAIYAETSDRMVLIPYSTDPVTAATYIEL